MEKELFKKIDQYMLNMTDGFIHDETHVYRVTNYALIIAKEYKDINEDILIASCLLHDVGRVMQGKGNSICHAMQGGNMAYEFLKQEGWDETDCLHVKECIASHRYKSKLLPKTMEAKILFDADKLDMTGAIGISRVLLYKGFMEESIYNEKSQNSFLSEYEERLLKVYDVFFTEKAREIAMKRKKLTQIFYEQIISEKLFNGTDKILVKKERQY